MENDAFLNVLKNVSKTRDEVYSILDNFGGPFALVKVEDDYGGFLREIIDDLKIFYEISKYPAVEIAVSFLIDYLNSEFYHCPSKQTLSFLKNWRKQK